MFYIVVLFKNNESIGTVGPFISRSKASAWAQKQPESVNYMVYELVNPEDYKEQQ